MIALGAIIIVHATWLQQSADGKASSHQNFANAPVAILGDDMYIAWWTNTTGDDEVTFIASDDDGATFTDKINLINSKNSDYIYYRTSDYIYLPDTIFLYKYYYSRVQERFLTG